MNKHHHPRDRSERRREAKKDHSLKPKKSNLRHKKEVLEIEELDNELREQVLGKTTS